MAKEVEMSRRIVLPLLALAVVLVSMGATLLAAETAAKPEKAAAPGIDKNELADAIEAHVKEVEAAGGGFYSIKDPVGGNTLQLKLVKVHRERVSQVAPETYFACADFKDPKGNVWDIDTFMKGPDKDHLVYDDATIHKENGKPRYNWYNDHGTWKKKDVTAEAEEEGKTKTEHPEHPEHPK